MNKISLQKGAGWSRTGEIKSAAAWLTVFFGTTVVFRSPTGTRKLLGLLVDHLKEKSRLKELPFSNRQLAQSFYHLKKRKIIRVERKRKRMQADPHEKREGNKIHRQPQKTADQKTQKMGRPMEIFDVRRPGEQKRGKNRSSKQIERNGIPSIPTKRLGISLSLQKRNNFHRENFFRFRVSDAGAGKTGTRQRRAPAEIFRIAKNDC